MVAARRARSTRSCGKAGRLAAVLSPHLTVEEAYLLGKYVRGIDPQAVLARGPGAGRRRGRDVPERLHDPRREVPQPPGRRRDRRALRRRAARTGTICSADVGRASRSARSGSPAAITTPWNDDGDGRASSRASRRSIVQDLFASPLWERADYQLPGAAFAEREGSYVNCARSAAIVPLGDSSAGRRAGPKGSCIGSCLDKPGLYNARSSARRSRRARSRTSPRAADGVPRRGRRFESESTRGRRQTC